MSHNCECKNRYLGLSPEMWYCCLDKTFCSPDGTCHDSVRMSADMPDAQKNEDGRKFDSDKLAYNLLPMDALDEVVRRFTHGAKKYAPDNWQKVDDAVERYSAALMRHYSAWRQGEQNDPEAPGLTHIGAVAWNALALVWFDLHKKEKHGYTTGGELHGK